MGVFQQVDAVILGGGIFGMSAAQRLLKRGASVLLVESDPELFSRASTVNQARVHLGYHYPRSLRTALHSAEFFHRFVSDYREAIRSDFTKIYGIASRNSHTSAHQFYDFCRLLQLPIESVAEEKYFRKGVVDGCFSTKEYVFDAKKILRKLWNELSESPDFELALADRVTLAEKSAEYFYLTTLRKKRVKTKLVVNATYAAINQVLTVFGMSVLPLKYELTELSIGSVPPAFRQVGITVMDGPFFSLMPYGFSERHSLTSVDYTPRFTSSHARPTFPCQSETNDCTAQSLKNCNSCPARPRSASVLMSQVAKKYLNEAFSFRHESTLYAVKTVSSSSELDDSRPTCIQTSSDSPKFISVLSGKINTIYELDAVLS